MTDWGPTEIMAICAALQVTVIVAGWFVVRAFQKKDFERENEQRREAIEHRRRESFLADIDRALDNLLTAAFDYLRHGKPDSGEDERSALLTARLFQLQVLLERAKAEWSVDARDEWVDLKESVTSRQDVKREPLPHDADALKVILHCVIAFRRCIGNSLARSETR